jgi:hypothetical protein
VGGGVEGAGGEVENARGGGGGDDGLMLLSSVVTCSKDFVVKSNNRAWIVLEGVMPYLLNHQT